MRGRATAVRRGAGSSGAGSSGAAEAAFSATSRSICSSAYAARKFRICSRSAGYADFATPGRVQAPCAVPAGDFPGRRGQFAKHGDIRIIFHCLPHLYGVTRVAHVVQHDSGEPERRSKGCNPGHHGGGSAGHLRAVEDKQHGSCQRQRHLGGGTGTEYIPSVIQPPVAFDNRKLRNLPVGSKAESGAGQRGRKFLRGQKVGIKICGGTSGGKGQPRGVNIVPAPFSRAVRGIRADKTRGSGRGRAAFCRCRRKGRI